MPVGSPLHNITAEFLINGGKTKEMKKLTVFNEWRVAKLQASSEFTDMSWVSSTNPTNQLASQEILLCCMVMQLSLMLCGVMVAHHQNIRERKYFCISC